MCACVHYCKHVPLFCVCIGRQDEHPFCYRCCPFISRSGSSAWILFPWLIISAVQWTRIPPECRVKPNHYSSMGVSADIVTLLFSIFITFPSEISEQDAEHLTAWSDAVRSSILKHLTWDWWTPALHLVPLLDAHWSPLVFLGRVQRARSGNRIPAGQYYSVGRRKRHFEVALDPTPAPTNYIKNMFVSPIHLSSLLNCQFSVTQLHYCAMFAIIVFPVADNIIIVVVSVKCHWSLSTITSSFCEDVTVMMCRSALQADLHCILPHLPNCDW